MRLIRFLPSALFVMLGVLATQAQPANDAFANAWTMSGSVVSTNGNSNNGTKETGEPNITGRNGGRSVWFRWTAPASGATRIDTAGSSFNTLLGVYTGTAVNALTLVAENDNVGGFDGTSRVEFSAQAGTVYRIAVDGRSNFGGGGPSSGNYNLNIQLLASVALTSPTNGAVYSSAAAIPLALDASSVPTPPVTGTEFFRNGILLGTDNTSPFTFSATGSPTGTNSFRGVAIDSGGVRWTSAPVNVLVLNPGVTITSPADGTSFTSTNPVNIAASGLLPSGTITNVNFFVNG